MNLSDLNLILVGVVGSTAHGLSLEGADDLDIMGVFAEDAAIVCGIGQHEHETRRTAKKGARSGPDDVDTVYYSLRKFGRLAAAGNPSVLILLFLNEYVTTSPAGELLLHYRDLFVNKSAGFRFLGYLKSQRAGLIKSREPGAHRPELVEQFGYDTKYAMHMIRLAYQGIELMEHEQITLPMPVPARDHCLAVRRGAVSYASVLHQATHLESRLWTAIERAKHLRDRADRELVDAALLSLHLTAWGLK